MAHPTSYLCSLSGVIPVDPVVSRVSGLLYSRALIEKELSINGGICPRTGEKLTKEDLIPVKSALLPGSSSSSSPSSSLVPPRPPSASSIPGLLALFQSEWEAVMLEVFHSRQQSETLKQDLAQALYREDAANRVIARLLQERDEARAKLLETEQTVAAAIKRGGNGATGPQQTTTAMEVDEEKQGGAAVAPSDVLPSSVLSSLTSTATTLSKGRKQWIKDEAAAAAKPEEIRQFQVGDRSYPLHAAANPGILCVDVHHQNQELLVTGGNDGHALVFNRREAKIVGNFKAHQSAVTDVKFHPSSDTIFTSSLDQSANIFTSDGGRYTLKHHIVAGSQAVTSLSVHASGEYFAAGGKDGSWAFYDVNEGRELKKMVGSPHSHLSRISFHPDGLILAAATGSGTAGQEGALRIYDLKGWKLAATLKDQHSSGLTSFSFSNNGFHCATGDAGGVVKIWDLRKLSVIHTIPTPPQEEGDKLGSSISAVSFDSSGSYLSSAVSSRILVYQQKSWEEITALRGHKERITGTVWLSQARGIVSVSLDRNLKVWV